MRRRRRPGVTAAGTMAVLATVTDRADGLRDDGGLGDRVADDADPSYACCPERHVRLPRSSRRRLRSRRGSPGSGCAVCDELAAGAPRRGGEGRRRQVLQDENPGHAAGSMAAARSATSSSASSSASSAWSCWRGPRPRCPRAPWRRPSHRRAWSGSGRRPAHGAGLGQGDGSLAVSRRSCSLLRGTRRPLSTVRAHQAMSASSLASFR